ncbi:hypothetical protein IQ209_06350 [Xenorhabdus sp. BG5]|nr:hypothetical protein [Xenorhabdus sp. BG5]
MQPASLPRGLLAKYLFASEFNALQFEYKERKDLSAEREEKYQRYDTSMVYRGESLKDEIKTIYSSLEQRQL